MVVNIDIQLVYVFILLFSCLLLAVIILLSLYLKAISQYTKLKTAGMGDKDLGIINNAQKVADQIINANKNLDEKFDKAVTTAIAQITSKWSKSAEDVLDKNLKALNDNLKRKIDEIYTKENANLESFKQEKLRTFEATVSEEVKRLSKEILKKDIDMSLHKKLIQDALEEATKNGVFN